MQNKKDYFNYYNELLHIVVFEKLFEKNSLCIIGIGNFEEYHMFIFDRVESIFYGYF